MTWNPKGITVIVLLCVASYALGGRITLGVMALMLSVAQLIPDRK